MNQYISEFLSLRCCDDVLNVVSPIRNIDKEITESMGILRVIRKIALKHKMEYTLYDLCAGNALTSVTAVHFLPIKYAFAFDKRVRSRDWFKVKKFEYIFSDIKDFDISVIKHNSIVIGVHACRELSRYIIDIFNKSIAKYLILMPCCVGKVDNVNIQLDKIDKYEKWCFELFCSVSGKKKIYRDKKVISPKNIIIVSEKQSNQYNP